MATLESFKLIREREARRRLRVANQAQERADLLAAEPRVRTSWDGLLPADQAAVEAARLWAWANAFVGTLARVIAGRIGWSESPHARHLDAYVVRLTGLLRRLCAFLTARTNGAVIYADLLRAALPPPGVLVALTSSVLTAAPPVATTPISERWRLLSF